MPQVEVSISGIVREQQSDEQPAAELAYEFKDQSVDEYDGAKRLQIAVGDTQVVDLSLSNPRILGIVLLSGTQLRLAHRTASTEATDLVIRRFFFSDVANVDQIKLKNDGPDDVVVRLFLVGLS